MMGSRLKAAVLMEPKHRNNESIYVKCYWF